MQITDIQPQKKNHNKVNVWIDGVFAFGLFLKDAALLELRPGIEIDEERLEQIKQTILLRDAKEMALRLLSQRDYTCKMMSDKLRQKQVPDDVAEQVIIFLEEYRYLDDASYAARYVRAHGMVKGKIRLRQELLQKGINGEAAEKALLQAPSEKDVLYQMAEKKLAALPEGYGEKELRRVKNYFLRRGFSYEEINSCFHRLADNKEW